MGFSDGVNERSITTISEDNVATMDTAHYASDSVISFTGSTTSGISDEAKSFSLQMALMLTLRLVSGTNARIFQFIAIGGTDITNVKVGQITHSNVTGNVDYTDPGFQPDFVILLPTRSNTINTFVSGRILLIGAFNKTGEQFAYCKCLKR